MLRAKKSEVLFIREMLLSVFIEWVHLDKVLNLILHFFDESLCLFGCLQESKFSQLRFAPYAL